MCFELCARRATIVLRAAATLFLTIHLALPRSKETYEDEQISTCSIDFELCSLT